MDKPKFNNINEARDFYGQAENATASADCSKEDGTTSEVTSLEGAEAFYAESNEGETDGTAAGSGESQDDKGDETSQAE